MLVMAALSPFMNTAGANGRAARGDDRLAADFRQLWSNGLRSLACHWYAAWIVAGIGMRLSLYDALFAALVTLYGQQARRTISASRWLAGWPRSCSGRWAMRC
jgi:hypothetical protein